MLGGEREREKEKAIQNPNNIKVISLITKCRNDC